MAKKTVSLASGHEMPLASKAGAGIKRAINDGPVTRSNIFIITKLWNNHHRHADAIKPMKAQNAAWSLDHICWILISKGRRIRRLRRWIRG
ncbi:hypothetical protein K490DRAFT_63065 [Saccharata proteae CBS 121410]|uniref:Uncharacterized protein n=1 Tax=Saccharata proteae CBS 121410 TaxID=1314787 RepID=A0A9P4HYJ7_9PEZI|nr:hypothetical protein K490DRAFT_63065 [Saccharata proteae CBS 121410]